MESKLNQLKIILGEVSDLNSAAALLGWDQQTYMPPSGAEWRGYQLSTLRTLAHDKFTSPEVGELLEELETYAKQLDPDSNDARLIKVTRKDHQKEVKIPSEWVSEFAKTTTLANRVWEEARKEDNFKKFQPSLEKVVQLRREYASFFTPYDHIYDPLLDDFEPGLKTKDVIDIFSQLRPQQVALIQEISERPQVDDAFINLSYDESKQWDFGIDVVTKFGYDWKRGRQDKSTHPFTTSFSVDDVRITTRLNQNDLATGMFGTMHESGHGLYDLGLDRSLARTPLATGASLAIHESQSRMLENLVGRSLAFWEYFYPKLQAIFANQLGNVNLSQFYKGINKVEPSLIRVEADEATYNLHIMLRLEIEIALMENKLDTKDLPEVWNVRMLEFLGIQPPSDTLGVLQDIHWSWGMIGYFSTYALGNLISAQLWECINTDILDINEQIRSGKFLDLLSWLREKIHRHGAKYEPQELVQSVTGSKINPTAYMKYLRGKYSEIYGLV